MNELSFFDMLRPTKENKQYPYECKVCGAKVDSSSFSIHDGSNNPNAFSQESHSIYEHYENNHPFELSVLTHRKDKPNMYS